MNPNMPYGPGGQIPMPPHHGQRRHDPYGRPQMGPHPGYQSYYQPMGPMMPGYQPYPQQWYPPPQYQYAQPYAGPRQPYYHPSVAMPPQMQPQQHHGPLVVGHPQTPSTPRAYPPPQPNQILPRRPSVASSVSQAPAETPPSRPQSQISAAQDVREDPQPAPVANGPIQEADTAVPLETVAESFVPPLPWLSVADSDFPPRATRGKRSIPRSMFQQPLYFPAESAPVEHQNVEESIPSATHVSTANAQSDAEVLLPAQTPTTLPSDTQSEHVSTQPTTPSSAIPVASASQQTPTQQKVSRATMPVVPVVPVMPTSPVSVRKVHRDSAVSVSSKSEAEPAVAAESAQSEPNTEAAPAIPPAPKSWADLVRKQSAAATANAAAVLPVINGLAAPRNETVGEVLSDFNVAEAPSKVAFLRPRGLVNTGNMCYMNSVSITSSPQTLRLTESGSSTSCFLHTIL